MLYFITIILALCSIVYELLLSQTLSAFLGNTTLRYSITIGLYMASMGIGAILVNNKMRKKSVYSLSLIELLLSIIGGFSVIYVFLADIIFSQGVIFFITVHALIILVGILTGIEIPLLIEIRSLEKKNTANVVLGFDYLGALTGTLLFTFIFYPKIGIFPTAFIIGFLNAVAGLLICAKRKVQTGRNNFMPIFLGNTILAVIIITCLLSSSSLEKFFVSKYLGF